jgi:hypothetical protein
MQKKHVEEDADIRVPYVSDTREERGRLTWER